MENGEQGKPNKYHSAIDALFADEKDRKSKVAFGKEIADGVTAKRRELQAAIVTAILAGETDKAVSLKTRLREVAEFGVGLMTHPDMIEAIGEALLAALTRATDRDAPQKKERSPFGF